MGTNTKQVILDAFLELLEKKEFSKVSITDITEKCNASRQTFYYHFENIEAMLEWAFDEQTKTACNSLKSDMVWREAVEPYTVFLKKYEILFKRAVESDKCLMVLALLEKSFYTYYDEFLTKYTNLSIIKSDDFFINCCASIMMCYVVKEIEKDKPDFDRMNDDIYTSIKKYGLGK